jgi:CRISPR subtype II RNA-guided endonuclease Cas9/Csn1
MEKTILGLDLGTSSIGWSLVKIEEENQDNTVKIKDFQIIDGGVRLFKEMMTPDGKETLNSIRTTKRGLRRLVKRRKNRLFKTAAILKKLNLMPQAGSLKDIINLDPYFLRVKGLDEKLSPLELTKVIMHIAKRRGFRSNRKDIKKSQENMQKLKDDAKNNAAKEGMTLSEYTKHLTSIGDDSSTLKGIALLEELLNDSQQRILGEYFYHEKQKDPTFVIRGRYLNRERLEEELKMILLQQACYYPILKEDKFDKNYKSFWQELKPINTNIDLLMDAIFEPRPLKVQTHLIGKCPYFKDKPRAPRSSLIFQEYSLWAKINNIKIITTLDGDKKKNTQTRDLTDDEKMAIVSLAETKSEITWSEVHKKLNLKENEATNFEKTGAQDKKITGLISFIELKKAIPSLIDQLSQEEKEKLIGYFSLGEIQLIKNLEQFAASHSLSSQEKEALFALDIPHTNDYASYSLKMLHIITPYIKSGVDKDGKKSYKEWDILKDLKNKQIIPQIKELKGDLLTPEDISQITFNPRVKKMLFELRKVLKALMKKYTKKAVQNEWIFKVELAREMKKEENQRKNITHGQTFLQSLREEATKELGTKSREDQNKYILWKEQEEACAYCGTQISMTGLTSEHYEIDHIIPISRIPDDSIANKVLSCRDCNRKKENKTPLEAFGGTQIWDNMLTRLGSITFKKSNAYQAAKKNSKIDLSAIPNDKRMLMNYGKFLRIQWTLEEVNKAKENFSSRQLNETRFGSKEAIKFLEHLRGVEEDPKNRKIITTKGGFTERIKRILKINSNIETITQDEIAQGLSPKSLLAAEIVPSKTEVDEKKKKQRSDHRHHFIDAFAMTFIGPSFENRVSTIEKTKTEYKDLLLDLFKNDAPILAQLKDNPNEAIKNIQDYTIVDQIEKASTTEKQKQYYKRQYNKIKRIITNHGEAISSYYEDLIEKIKEVLPTTLDTLIVSHAQNRKITDALHEDSVYGVLNSLPVSYLSHERLATLLKDKYISKEVDKAIAIYINENKFLPLIEGESIKKEANNPTLYAFRRGNQKQNDKNGKLPAPLELKEFWDEKINGPYKKDHIPLLKPLYTMKKELKLENIKNLAVIKDQDFYKEKLETIKTIQEEYKLMSKQNKKKNKDFTLEDLELAPTLWLEVQKLLDQSKMKKAQKTLADTGFYDDFIKHIFMEYKSPKVLLINFAKKKFSPESKEDSHKAFDTGNNHHMAVFEKIVKDKKGNIVYEENGITPKKERKGIIVTALDAITRARRKQKPKNEKDKVIYENLSNYEPSYKDTLGENINDWKFLFSLCKNDYVKIVDTGLLYKVTQMTKGEIFLSYINTDGKYNGNDTPRYLFSKSKIEIVSGLKGANSLLSKIEHKYSVDPLGKVNKEK